MLHLQLGCEPIKKHWRRLASSSLLAEEYRRHLRRSTPSSDSIVFFFKTLEQFDGYVFHLVYIWLPTVELAVARVAERVRRGGHTVPEDTVRRRYDRSLFNFFGIYSQFADSWLMVNNSVRPRPRVVAKRAVGRSTRIFRADEWSALRAKYERQESIEG